MTGNHPAQLNRIRHYQKRMIDRREADHLVLEAYRSGAVLKSKITTVLKEYDEPRHPEFRERNVWSLFNAFTEVYKAHNMDNTVARSMRLNNTFDQFSGLTSEPAALQTAL